MKTPSRPILCALLFSLAFGCHKDASLFQSKGIVSSFISGKDSALGTEKSLFSADSNYIAFFEGYKGAFIDFHDSMIQNQGLSALQTLSASFNDCIAQDSADLNCFSFISNLTDSSAVNDYFSAIATHLAALRGDYSSLSDAEFTETLELTITASVKNHYTANPLTALLSVEGEEINPPAAVPICYSNYIENLGAASAFYATALILCGISGPGYIGCATVSTMVYWTAVTVSGFQYNNCLCQEYQYNC